jgi:hypothetical protein
MNSLRNGTGNQFATTGNSIRGNRELKTGNRELAQNRSARRNEALTPRGRLGSPAGAAAQASVAGPREDGDDLAKALSACSFRMGCDGKFVRCSKRFGEISGRSWNLRMPCNDWKQTRTLTGKSLSLRRSRAPVKPAHRDQSPKSRKSSALRATFSRKRQKAYSSTH